MVNGGGLTLRRGFIVLVVRRQWADEAGYSTGTYGVVRWADDCHAPLPRLALMTDGVCQLHNDGACTTVPPPQRPADGRRVSRGCIVVTALRTLSLFPTCYATMDLVLLHHHGCWASVGRTLIPDTATTACTACVPAPTLPAWPLTCYADHASHTSARLLCWHTALRCAAYAGRTGCRFILRCRQTAGVVDAYIR